MSVDRSNTRRRLYEAPEASDGAFEPEVLPPVMREPPPAGTMHNDVDSLEKLRLVRAKAIVVKHTLGSTGVGVLPFAIGSSLICGGIQIRMIRNLCRCYKVKFSKNAATAALTVTLGVVASVEAVNIAGKVAFMLLPGWARVLKMVASVAVANGTTYLIGRIFVYHFEMGGSLFDLDADKTCAIITKLKMQEDVVFTS